VSDGSTPTKTKMPRSISPITDPATDTEAAVTRCSKHFIATKNP